MISHYPEKKLTQHIKEVQKSSEFLLSFHSAKFKKAISVELLKYIISKHDEGKKTIFFQEYIKNPENYNGNKQLKNHSKLSALMAFLNTNKIDSLNAFKILQCVGGHHSKIKSINDLISYWSESEKHLCEQLNNIADCDLTSVKMDGPTDSIYNYLEDCFKQHLIGITRENALKFRLQTQLLYSVLLESDKAMLAVPDFSKHKGFKRNNWNKNLIDDFIGHLQQENPEKSQMNNLRNLIRNDMLDHLKTQKSNRIFTLTSPTGSGKTLLSATWLLEERENLKTLKNIIPKMIIILPFLSIINQTAEEYKKILKKAGVELNGSWLMESHSLSERNYSNDIEENEESFFIDTWRSDLIITTYDQFLYSIFNPQAKYQMRFHNIFDSVIVFDEIQSLPTKLWKPLDSVLQTITSLSESRILLMSATMPGFVSKPNHLLPDYKKYFNSLNRYKIDLSDVVENKIISVRDFLDRIKEKIRKWIQDKERVLITLNTRKSAQNVFLGVKNIIEIIDETFPIFFISSNVVPEDRLLKIKTIKENKPCIVISTQSIEAGVDIDMTKVIRDFAPLDSLIQIAGRCNRNLKYKTSKKIKIIQLKSDKGRLFSDMIYNKVHLASTREVLKDTKILPENKVLSISKKYFSSLSKKTNTGKSYIDNFSYWKDYTNIREVLRGEQIDKYEFCLLDRDLKLKNKIKQIFNIEDRWERREKFKKISSGIAKLTVSVIAEMDFNPEEIAENYYGIWNLKDEFYDKNIGINPHGCKCLIL